MLLHITIGLLQNDSAIAFLVLLVEDEATRFGIATPSDLYHIRARSKSYLRLNKRYDVRHCLHHFDFTVRYLDVEFVLEAPYDADNIVGGKAEFLNQLTALSDIGCGDSLIFADDRNNLFKHGPFSFLY